MILTEGTTKQLHCLDQMRPIRDALEVIGGKWKIIILTAIMQGNRRFTEIETSLPNINPKVLANELKDLEEHLLIQRIVRDHLLIEYVATEYSYTLKKVMMELHAWGTSHGEKIRGQ
ncbi:winged helix-turn-helix transcriptional regulator [Larkinella ripae]